MMIPDDPQDAPTDERCTRLTWRPGKRRRRQKRINPHGGRKAAPAAFLEAAKKHQFTKGITNHRVCKATKRDGRPCRRIALTHCTVCGAHGGWLVWHRLGILQKTGKREAFRANRATASPPNAIQTPHALIQLQIWKEADERTRIRMAQAYHTPAWPMLLSQLKARGTTLYG
jgi:hypothetical protein